MVPQTAIIRGSFGEEGNLRPKAGRRRCGDGPTIFISESSALFETSVAIARSRPSHLRPATRRVLDSRCRVDGAENVSHRGLRETNEVTEGGEVVDTDSEADLTIRK
jgi:hypothetical protein